MEVGNDPLALAVSEPASVIDEQDRRDDPRIPVDEEATLLVLSRGASLPCRVVEVSLSGCRVNTENRYSSGIPVRVEAAFRLRGIAFRLNADAEWTDGKHSVGIRFVDVAPHRMEQLVEVLCEVAAENASRAVKRAAERLAAEEKARKEADKGKAIKPDPSPSAATKPTPAPPQPGSQPGSKEPKVAHPPQLAAVKPAPPAGPSIPAPILPTRQEAAGPLRPATPSEPAKDNPTAPPPKPSGRDRRDQSRHQVDTSATILLVDVSSRLPGRILNLSMGGCRIRTEERFPVGIYTRVETEFHLEGLPFRIGGVVQAIQDKQHVGIRFLDMSERKREQLAQLIAEIDESQAFSA